MNGNRKCGRHFTVYRPRQCYGMASVSGRSFFRQGLYNRPPADLECGRVEPGLTIAGQFLQATRRTGLDLGSAKTIDAVGTSETLKHGICRAEYDMGPSLSNFIAFMDSDQHDPLRLSVRNKKLTQLLYIGETGELPQNFNRLDWFGTTLSRMHDPLIRQRYSTDQIKEIAHSLTKMIYPDIRVSQNSFYPQNAAGKA